MLVACSVLVMFTVLASALAFSASALALRMVLRRVTMAMMVAARPPPRMTFNTSLQSIVYRFYLCPKYCLSASRWSVAIASLPFWDERNSTSARLS